jgi:hypothetical protein
MILFALFVVVAFAGEITLKNNPTKVIKCGDPAYVLEWTYDSSAMSFLSNNANKEVQIVLKYDGLPNSDIAVLGKVTYPQSMVKQKHNKHTKILLILVPFFFSKQNVTPKLQFSVVFPKPWPASWLKNTNIKNDGKEYPLLLEVQAVADTDINSASCGICS